MLAANQQRAQRRPGFEVVGGCSVCRCSRCANCAFHHAETILLKRFKPSAVGVTARLNQLQNASGVSTSHCSVAEPRALRKEEKKKCLKNEFCNHSHGLHEFVKCTLVVHFPHESEGTKHRKK